MTPSIATARPVMIMFIGYPGAGKTHAASKLAEKLGAFYLHADEIRFELYEEVGRTAEQDRVVNRLSESLISKLAKQKVNVVLDVLSNTLASRKRISSIARKYGYRILVVWVQTDQTTAFARASARDRRRADDKYGVQVDKHTFARLVNELRPPEREDYVVISGKHAFKNQYATILRKLAQLRLLIDPTGESAKAVLERRNRQFIR